MLFLSKFDSVQASIWQTSERFQLPTPNSYLAVYEIQLYYGINSNCMHNVRQNKLKS